jgi:FkbM family methyltransferase
MKQGIRYFVNKRDGKYPFTYMDVGAMGGVPLKWSYIFDVMRVIGFEPDRREFGKLKNDNNVKYLNYALHKTSQDLKYYITQTSGKSSFLRPNSGLLSQYVDADRFKVIQEKCIPATRVRNLNSVIEENCVQDVDFIKLDTQGSELMILQGGQEKLIPMIFGTQIEVEFVEMYERQPLFRDVDDFMDSKGFSLIDLRRAYWKRKNFYDYRGKGQLIFGDALYFKKIDIFRQELLGRGDTCYGKCKIFKSILICMVYRLLDYAVAVADVGLELGYLNKTEYENAISEIKRDSFLGLFLNARLYTRIYGIVNSLLQKIKPRSYLGWADSDREIGNIVDI